MNPSNPSVLARPLFAFGIGVTMLAAAAIYSAPARSDVTFNLNGCTSVSVSGTQVTCVINSSSGGGGGAPSCSIIANQSPSSSVGGPVVLSANCSNYSPTAYYWAKNGTPFANTASISDQLPGNTGTTGVNYVYELNACAATACLPSTSVTISVPTGTSGGGGGGGGGASGWPVSCPGYTKTVAIDLPWQSTDATTRVLTANYGGFGSNDALVVRFTPPAGSASSGDGSISMAEYVDPRTTRFSTISTSPCDFSQTNWFTTWNVSTGSTLNYSLQVGGSQQSSIMLLQPGVTYYLNVRNTDSNGTHTCASGTTCNMFLDFYKPPGT